MSSRRFEGTIRERPGGLWEARYRVNGRRRSVYAKTRQEAAARLRTALRDADHGIAAPTGRLTVGAYLDEWLAGVRLRLRPSTARFYEAIIRLYIVPAIGRVRLAKLAPEDVTRMLARLTARGDLSPTTVRYAYSALRTALGRAYKEGKVLRNVATLVDPPRKATPEMHPLSAAQVAAFLASVAGDRLGALYVVAYGLGLRQGEALALRWEDIDLERGTLTVRHTLERGTHRLAEPKTDRARRTLTMPRIVARALAEHRRRQLAERLAAGRLWQDRGLVFTTSRGTALDGVNVTGYFQAALERAGLPRQRFHDARHAAATMLLERGEELGVVSKVLGHSNLATTADVYAHLTRSLTERVAERMDAILTLPAAGTA
jgi:integrase